MHLPVNFLLCFFQQRSEEEVAALIFGRENGFRNTSVLARKIPALVDFCFALLLLSQSVSRMAGT